LRPTDTFNNFELQGYVGQTFIDSNVHASEPILSDSQSEHSSIAMEEDTADVKMVSSPLVLKSDSPKELTARTKRTTVSFSTSTDFAINEPSVERALTSSNSSDQVFAARNGKIDDHQRVMAQAPPPSLIPESHPSPQPLHKSKEKKKSNLFKDWVKKKSQNSVFKDYLSESASKPTRAVFGTTLEDSANICHVNDNEYIPAVLYRCIEYLEAKDGNFM
jgi:hypothetical protein